MTTPTIYNIGQLRAYLQGRLSAIDSALPAAQGRMHAYAEVVALIEGIEAHEAKKPDLTSHQVRALQIQLNDIADIADQMVKGRSPVEAAIQQGTAIAQAIEDESGYQVGSVDSLRR